MCWEAENVYIHVRVSVCVFAELDRKAWAALFRVLGLEAKQRSFWFHVVCVSVCVGPRWISKLSTPFRLQFEWVKSARQRIWIQPSSFALRRWCRSFSSFVLTSLVIFSIKSGSVWICRHHFYSDFDARWRPITHTHVYKTIVCSRSIVRGHPITFSYFVSLSLASFSSSCYSEGGKIWLEATAGTSWSTHGPHKTRVMLFQQERETWNDGADSSPQKYKMKKKKNLFYHPLTAAASYIPSKNI